MAHDDDGNDSGQTGAVVKTVLMTLGVLAAISLAVKVSFILLGNLLFFGLLGGAGYLGYRMIAGGNNRKSLSSRRGPRGALGSGRSRGSSGDDFERKMRELDAIEKRLDAEIGKR